MPTSFYYQSLNVGVVDADKLHRTDLERMRLAAEEQTNLICDAVGKAFLRPGLEHLAPTQGGAYSRLLPFVAGGQQAYGISLTDNALKIIDGDAFVSRPAVSTVVQSGDFDSDTGWDLTNPAGAGASVADGHLRMQAFARNIRARARQQVTVAGGDVGKEHGLRIFVERGPIMFRVGTAAGGQQLIRETTLRTGWHSLAFIAPGNFWIEISATQPRQVLIGSVNVEAAGDVVLPTIWEESDLKLIRFDQSLDVMFLACEGRKQQRIETRGDNSWSICNYDSDDGPFRVDLTPMKIKTNALEANGLIETSLPYFTQDHLGAMFRLYHEGQKISTQLASDGEFTPTIMVTGINEPDYNERSWSYTIAGTWAGTLRVQRSFDGEDIEFHSFRKAQGTADVDITTNVGPVVNDDNDDNAIAYYRIGFEPGTYTSGSAEISISYSGGGGFGICRVTKVLSETAAEMEILVPFKGYDFTDNWREGAWSDAVGWPTSVSFHEGRLWWAGYDAVWGSVSDAYDSFNEELVGDAGPILRAIALGGRNEARWLVALSNLMLGTNSRIATLRGSSLDEVLTPENFGVRSLTRIGSAPVNPAALADDRALFVEAAGQALYELTFAGDKGRFLATEFSKLTTSLFTTGITDIAVQNRPDQRIWLATGAGDCVCIVFEPAQQVVAYIPIRLSQPSDQIESVIVLPGDDGQDRVLMSVRRLVNGVTSRRIERLAMDRDAKPIAIARCLDAHKIIGAGSPTVALPHLIGRTVWAWVDGAYIEDENGDPVPFVVPGSGSITLPVTPAIGGCVGLPYVGRYKSAKIEYASGPSTSMLQKKVISRAGFMFADYCRSGIKFGTEFDNPDHPLFNLPAERDGIPVPSDIILGPDRLEPLNATDGPITLDARLCVEVTKPATILSLVLEFEGHGG